MKYLLIFILIVSGYFNVIGQLTPNVESISAGNIIEFDSKILKETRQLYIHEPEGLWDMDVEMKNLPVIFVLDGESQFLHTVSTSSFLSAAPNGNDLMPKSIVVGIPNTHRNRDLTPIKGMIGNDSSSLEITGGGKKFLSFITDEIIPYLDSHYATSSHRTIIGHSLGGLITFEALLRKREYFDNFIAIDPALGFANGRFRAEILDTLRKSELSKKNLFFATAITKPTFLKADEFLKGNSDFAKLLAIPNNLFLHEIQSNDWSLQINSKFYPDENHFSLPLLATADGLRKLYEFYPFPEIIDYYHPNYKDKLDLIEKIKDHYKIISTKMGYDVFPMEGYINSFAFGLSFAGRQDLAIALFKYNIKLHPNNPKMYNNLGYYYGTIGKIKNALEIYKKSIKILSDEEVLTTIERLEAELEEAIKH